MKIKIDSNINEWEKACKEWLKGCSCSSPSNQEECKECTKAFHNHLRNLAKKENYKELDWYVIQDRRK